MRGLGRIVAAALTTLAILAVGAGGAVTATPSFHLVFDGKHNEKLWHEGPFTSSAPLCPSGFATDVAVDDASLTAVRRFSCPGGDELTARVASLRAEHGGAGNWQILGGTGALAGLRGMGTFKSVRLTGSADDPASITFRSTWDGYADFDAMPPAITISGVALRRLAQPRLWQVRAAVAFSDTGGPISWDVVVSDRRNPFSPLASKRGAAGSGPIGIALRVRVPTGARLLRLKLDASDPVGNQSSSVKVLRLP